MAEGAQSGDGESGSHEQQGTSTAIALSCLSRREPSGPVRLTNDLPEMNTVATTAEIRRAGERMAPGAREIWWQRHEPSGRTRTGAGGLQTSVVSVAWCFCTELRPLG